MSKHNEGRWREELVFRTAKNYIIFLFDFQHVKLAIVCKSNSKSGVYLDSLRTVLDRNSVSQMKRVSKNFERSLTKCLQGDSSSVLRTLKLHFSK